jgi:hypothetical protein
MHLFVLFLFFFLVIFVISSVATCSSSRRRSSSSCCKNTQTCDTIDPNTNVDVHACMYSNNGHKSIHIQKEKVTIMQAHNHAHKFNIINHGGKIKRNEKIIRNE